MTPDEMAEILAFFNLREQDRKKEADKRAKQQRPTGNAPKRRGRRR